MRIRKKKKKSSWSPINTFRGKKKKSSWSPINTFGEVSVLHYFIFFFQWLIKPTLLSIGLIFCVLGGNSWVSLVAHQKSIRLPMQEVWVWSRCWEDPLEEGMATHPSIPAWRIPWTEEPGEATVHGVAKSWTRRKWLKHRTGEKKSSKRWLCSIWVNLWPKDGWN